VLSVCYVASRGSQSTDGSGRCPAHLSWHKHADADNGRRRCTPRNNLPGIGMTQDNPPAPDTRQPCIVIIRIPPPAHTQVCMGPLEQLRWSFVRWPVDIDGLPVAVHACDLLTLLRHPSISHIPHSFFITTNIRGGRDDPTPSS